MTDQDRPAFAEALYALSEAFNEPCSAVRAEAYFDALSDFELPQVNAAVRIALRTCKFFPKPVELREQLTGTAQDGAETAWAAVLREIRRVGYLGVPNVDARTLRAVNELWGGWRRLCETLPAEGPELVGWIKQFKATYESVDRIEARQATLETLHPNVRAFIQGEQKRIGAA